MQVQMYLRFEDLANTFVPALCIMYSPTLCRTVQIFLIERGNYLTNIQLSTDIANMYVDISR